jgi:hypothetical protein
MANLSAVASVGSALGALTGLIAVTPQQNVGYQPQSAASLFNPPLTPTILFNYEGENKVTLDSDITDHYVEDNTALQDQIALRPIIISTNGFVGELNDIAPSALQVLKSIADKLIFMEAYTPALTAAALDAYNVAAFAYTTATNVAASATTAISSINGGSSGQNILNQTTLVDLTKIQSKQQLYFTQFFGYWQSRVLFTIQTPWGLFNNCAIQNMTATQDETTNVITDFNMTFKVINFASTNLTTGAVNAQGRNATQQAPATNQGQVPVGPAVPLSLPASSVA